MWELFLQHVEVNSQQHGDVSRCFSQTTGSGLIERVFHRKIQSKKLFAYRERIETILVKSNELLHKVSAPSGPPDELIWSASRPIATTYLSIRPPARPPPWGPKCYQDYCQAYALALTNPANYMSDYIASHK